MNDLIIQNIQELILPKSTDKPLKGRELDELEVVENGTVVVKDGKVVYSGPHTDEYEANETIDATGRLFHLRLLTHIRTLYLAVHVSMKCLSNVKVNHI